MHKNKYNGKGSNKETSFASVEAGFGSQDSVEAPTGRGIRKERSESNSRDAMISLSLNRINAKSPCFVTEEQGGYQFETDSGVIYRIRFIDEMPIGGCETYQFAISKITSSKSGFDPDVRATVFIIIDEFFAEYQNVLLYICDTSDGREEVRNRLFIHWFTIAASPNRFTIRTANAQVEGEGIYAAIIVENSNPRLSQITEDFDSTAAALTDKPEQ